METFYFYCDTSKKPDFDNKGAKCEFQQHREKLALI